MRINQNGAKCTSATRQSSRIPLFSSNYVRFPLLLDAPRAANNFRSFKININDLSETGIPRCLSKHIREVKIRELQIASKRIVVKRMYEATGSR